MANEDNQEQGTVIQEFHERLPRRWPLLLFYIILAFVVALLLVFGGRALYRHGHPKHVKTVPADTKKLPGKPPASGAKTPSGTGSQTANNTALPNSGPGQVVGLFVGASAVAAGVHYMINTQRSVKAD